MMTDLIYQEDKFELDANKITLGTDKTHGATTIFHDVVIASEIVQPYSDGYAFKQRDELEAYAWTVEGRHVILGSHPDTNIISDRTQVHGRTENVRYVKNLNDPQTKRPNRAGVVADITIFDEKAPKNLLSDMKRGVKRDVSIGFFFNKDTTPGEFKGISYDYVQRNMFHDHLAAALDNGRCPSPFCGLGADEIADRLTGDPFAGFANWAECKREIKEKNPKLSDERVEKICGSLKAKHEDKYGEETLLVKAARVLRMLLEEEYEALRGERDAIKMEEKTVWWKEINWKEPEYTTIFDNLDDEVRQLIIDEGLCPHCDEEEEEEDTCEEGYEKNPETGECEPIKEEEDVKLTLQEDPEAHKKPKKGRKDESFNDLIIRGDKILSSVTFEKE